MFLYFSHIDIIIKFLFNSTRDVRDCVLSRSSQRGRNHIAFVGDSRARQLFCTASRFLNDALVQAPTFNLSSYSELTVFQRLSKSPEPTTRTLVKHLTRPPASPGTRCRRYGRLHQENFRARSALQTCDDLDALLNLQVVLDDSEPPCEDMDLTRSVGATESVLVESSLAVQPAADALLQPVALSAFDVEALWNTYVLHSMPFACPASPVRCERHPLAARSDIRRSASIFNIASRAPAFSRFACQLCLYSSLPLPQTHRRMHTSASGWI